MKRLICCIVVALYACGCETAVPPVARIPFPEEEYAALPKTGTGIVKGQAFLRTRGGDVKTAAGSEMRLNPVTSYSQQWYSVNYEAYLLRQGTAGPVLGPPDPRLAKYILLTTGDGEGRFEFKNVPPGDYYLVTEVWWEAPAGSGAYLVRQGGPIVKRITVKNGEEQNVILTR
jgi:hypothetical protein